MGILLVMLLGLLAVIAIIALLYWNAFRLLWWPKFHSIPGYRWFALSATVMLVSGPLFFFWPTTLGMAIIAAMFLVSAASWILSWLRVWKQIRVTQ